MQDDNSACSGSVETVIGSFVASNRNRGKLVTELELPLAGSNSEIGSYLRLVNAGGSQVACCELLEMQSYWKEGGAARR